MITSTNQFLEHFEIRECRTEATLKDSFRLRYQTYCIEQGYPIEQGIEPGLEKDEYDFRSRHSIIFHRESGVSVATVRLILCNGEDKFPLEHFEILRRFERDRDWLVPKCTIAEISRFAVSKHFRKRVEERDVTHGITSHVFESTLGDRRRAAEITFGLFHAVVKMSHAYEITHWYALMEPSLIRLLGKFGIYFITVGPPVEHFGLRQPCIAIVEDVLAGIYRFNIDNWQFITDHGEYYGTDYLLAYQPVADMERS